jgi:chemotaxis signal transduction protein
MDVTTQDNVSLSDWLKPSQILGRTKAPAQLGQRQIAKAAAVRFGYRVASLGFLVGEGVLSEYVLKPTIYPIPNVNTAVRGYVNLQGALVAVWDLHVLLNIGVDGNAVEQMADANAAVLVLGRGDARVGLVVDGLPVALRVLEQTNKPSQLPNAIQGYVKDALISDGSLWFEFDHDAFVRAQARQQQDH